MSGDASSRVVEISRLIAEADGFPDDAELFVKINGLDKTQQAAGIALESIRKVAAASQELWLTTGAASVLDQLSKIELRGTTLTGSAVDALTAALASSAVGALKSDLATIVLPGLRDAAARFQDAILPKSQMELLAEKIAVMDTVVDAGIAARSLVGLDMKPMWHSMAGEIAKLSEMLDSRSVWQSAADDFAEMSRVHGDWLVSSAPAITYIPPRRKSRDREDERIEEVEEAEPSDFGELLAQTQPESEILYLPRRRGRPKGSFLRTPERVLMVYAELYASGDYVTQDALAKALRVTLRTLQHWLTEKGWAWAGLPAAAPSQSRISFVFRSP